MVMLAAIAAFTLRGPVQSELQDMLRRTAEGDRAEFSRLYDTTSSRLFAVIRRILPRNELAEDALQETYLRIWQRANSYDARVASPMAWLATIARNQAIDSRRRFAERLSGASDELDETHASALPDPLAMAEQNDSLKLLTACLGKLPADRRDMVLLAYYQGFSREELSTRFKRPVTTVKTLLRRSLIMLKECLDGH
jgi:RNA polymerase sigma-70 factor, ECF subfamily